MADIQSTFMSIGGEFITPPPLLKEKISHLKAFLFDWDGVFNTGIKGNQVGSLYSEADSMGTNLIRFSHWKQHQQLPFISIVTGENNPAAFHLAKREHFGAVYYGIKSKKEALIHICQSQNITPAEVAFFFDDIQDIPIAQECGVRFLMRRKASPLFLRYIKENIYCDYITGHTGGEHAVREACELLLGLQGVYKEIVEARVAFAGEYATYLTLRNTPNTLCYTPQNGKITAVAMPE